MTKDIGIGVIGVGMGLDLLYLNQKPDSRFEIRALCAAHLDKVTQIGKDRGIPFVTDKYQELLQRDDLQVIVVFSPDHLHARHIKDSLNAGKHVIVTKPMVTSLEDALDIVKLTDKTGLKFLVGETCRFYTTFVAVKKLYDDGDLGELIFGEGHYVHDLREIIPLTPWRIEVPQDFMYGGCCHPVDSLVWFFGEAQEVQAYGAKIVCQLNHAGRQTRPSGIRGLQPVAPSPIPCPFLNAMPRELGTDEVEAIVKKFVDAAIRARTAGYDGIELHGAHGYLISQFMSASANHRKDRYGGDLLKRMSFPLEIIQGIRKELGTDYPILFRISAEEFIEGGRTLDESKKAAKLLEEAGVSVLDVTAGTYGSMRTMIEPMSYGEAWKIHLAESIKKVVSIPVIGVGVIRSPHVAEELLEKGKVDFVALGRAMLADPYWPQKVREGREEDINRCISCNTGCIGGRIFRGLDIRCAVNPLTGRERLKSQLTQVSTKKKIYIAGGGPAGMMAAIVASRRGHEVTLF